jgi:hypothetical protein
MILSKYGESLKIGDKVFTVGDRVLANDSSEYEGLYGEIIEIKTDPDKDTDNEGVDIHVCFEVPEDKKLISEIEDKFSKLYGESKTIDEIALDLVIMTPDMIDVVEE